MSAWRELSEHVYKNIGSDFVHRASARARARTILYAGCLDCAASKLED